MKKKVIIISILSALIFIAAVLAGLNAIFTVNAVKVEFSVYSDAARQDALSLQEELDGFIGKSSVMLDLNEVEQTVEKYPYFQLNGIEKALPQEIKLQIEERRELCALQTEEGFRVYDAEGNFLVARAENANRVDGAPNILFECEEGSEEFSLMLAVCNAMEGALPDVRMSVVSLKTVENAGVTKLHIQMREGVKIVLFTPFEDTQNKTLLAVEEYLALSDIERMDGEIWASDRAEYVPSV